MSKIQHICGNCQNVVSDSAKFCTDCGKGLKPLGDSLSQKDMEKVNFVKTSATGYVGPDFAKKASDEDIMAMIKLKDEKAKIYNSQMLPIKGRINTLRKKYKLKADKFDSVELVDEIELNFDGVRPNVVPVAVAVAGISKMLKEFGYTAASKDVSAENYEKYAKWVTKHFKNMIWLTDPVSRKKTKNVKAEEAYNKAVALFKKVGIEAAVDAAPVEDSGPLKEENKDKLKEKVTKILIKSGNNPDDVKKMIKLEFEGAFNVFKKHGGTPGKIAEYIRTVY